MKKLELEIVAVVVGGVNRTSVDGRTISDKDDSLENILKAAGFTFDGTGKIQGSNVPDYFFVTKPDGTSEKIAISSGALSSADLKKSILLGTKITSVRQPPAGKKLIEYTVQDLSGNTHKIPVEVDDVSNAKAKWSEIIKSATDKGITIGNTPSGYTGNWKAGTSDLNNNTEVDSTQIIKPEFTKSLNYSVDKNGNGAQNTPITVPYPQTEATLKQIMDGNVSNLGNNSAGNSFTGWKVTLPDGTVKTVTSDQINNGSGNAAGTFPAGTKVEPTWYGDGGAYGGPGRTLTNKSNPSVGDGVTKDGEIIPKTEIQANDGRVIGYVYAVNTDKKTVSALAKNIVKNKGWSSITANGSAVYTGIHPTDASKKSL